MFFISSIESIKRSAEIELDTDGLDNGGRDTARLDNGGLDWWHGVVASVVRRTNEVTLQRAWLVLGWVTVFGRVYCHGR